MKPFHPSMLLDWPLTPDSFVMNVGGNAGRSASEIHDKFKCMVAIFEPLPEYVLALQKRFAGNQKIIVNAHGLGGREGQCRMFWHGEMSGCYCEGEPLSAYVMAINSYMTRAQAMVDLLEINIEGMEFELLESIIDYGLATRFRNIQVQFHGVVPNHQARKDAIRRDLLKTHNLVFDDPWCWEGYSLK